jgi:hypothetical protein
MGLRKIACLLCVLWISGCASVRAPAAAPDAKKVRDFAEIYRRAKESGLATAGHERQIRLGPDIGQERPYYPVYQPPRIVKVWVPAHTPQQDKRVLVAGHWTFVMVEDPHWYIEDYMESASAPAASVPVVPQKDGT